MKIHKHDVCEKAILDSNCCIPPPLMSVNVNVTINRPPLSFVHTSKYSSIIPAGFHEFVDRRFRSICKSIYSPGHAIRLLNVLRRLLHPHQHTHQNPHQNHHQIHHPHQCHPYYLLTILVPSEKRKPDVVWGFLVKEETNQKWKSLRNWSKAGWKTRSGETFWGWTWRVWRLRRGAGGRGGGGRGWKSSKTTLRYFSKTKTKTRMWEWNSQVGRYHNLLDARKGWNISGKSRCQAISKTNIILTTKGETIWQKLDFGSNAFNFYTIC